MRIDSIDVLEVCGTQRDLEEQYPAKEQMQRGNRKMDPVGFEIEAVSGMVRRESQFQVSGLKPEAENHPGAFIIQMDFE